MQPETPRFTEWLAAEKAAREAEHRLHVEMMAGGSSGPAPDPSLVADARSKRAKAHWLMDEAIREMKELADAFQQRVQTRHGGSTGNAGTKH